MNTRLLCVICACALAVSVTAVELGRGQQQTFGRKHLPDAMGKGAPPSQSSGMTDRDRQELTMRAMRLIATANFVMREDTGRYAKSLEELQPLYLKEAILDDGWGNAFVYVAEADTYTLTSLGSDGAAGPAPPTNWSDEPYDPDMILKNGLFTQAPTSSVSTSPDEAFRLLLWRESSSLPVMRETPPL